MMCLTICEDVRAQLSHASLVIYMSRPELWRNQQTLCGPGLEEKGQFCFFSPQACLFIAEIG